MKTAQPRVSVCVITYNHEKFVHQAISSILAQETDFSFEVVVVDDRSADETPSICAELQEENPDLVRFTANVVNLGMHKNFLYALSLCNGEYVALCEGDDYWTDVEKLQKQVEFLVENRGCSACFHDSVVVDENGSILRDSHYTATRSVYSESECIGELRGSYPTASLMFRSETIRGGMPSWFTESACDTFLLYMVARFGGVAHIPQSMSAYRIHPGGIWQGEEWEKNLRELISREYLLLADPYMSSTYGPMINAKLSQLGHLGANSTNPRRRMRLKYLWIYYKYSSNNRIHRRIALGLFGRILFGDSFIDALKRKLGR